MRYRSGQIARLRNQYAFATVTRTPLRRLYVEDFSGENEKAHLERRAGIGACFRVEMDSRGFLMLEPIQG